MWTFLAARYFCVFVYEQKTCISLKNIQSSADMAVNSKRFRTVFEFIHLQCLLNKTINVLESNISDYSNAFHCISAKHIKPKTHRALQTWYVWIGLKYSSISLMASHCTKRQDRTGNSSWLFRLFSAPRAANHTSEL